MDSALANFYSRNSVVPGALGPMDALFEIDARIPGVLAPLPESSFSGSAKASASPAAANTEHSTGMEIVTNVRMSCWGGNELEALFDARDKGLPAGSLPYATPGFAELRGAAVLPNSYASAYFINTLPNDIFTYGSTSMRKEKCGCGGPKLKN